MGCLPWSEIRNLYTDFEQIFEKDEVSCIGDVFVACSSY
jgi:hypothetical protein